MTSFNLVDFLVVYLQMLKIPNISSTDLMEELGLGDVDDLEGKLPVQCFVGVTIL